MFVKKKNLLENSLGEVCLNYLNTKKQYSVIFIYTFLENKPSAQMRHLLENISVVHHFSVGVLLINTCLISHPNVVGV